MCSDVFLTNNAWCVYVLCGGIKHGINLHIPTSSVSGPVKACGITYGDCVSVGQ